MMDDTEASSLDIDASTTPAADSNDEYSKFDYAAFISYRRSDASGIAKWICHRLESWRTTRDLIAAVTPELAVRLQQKRSVFVDTRFEVGNEDFWQAHIEPALARSAQLIVLSSPNALQKLPDGAANWVEREIDTFYGLGSVPHQSIE